MADDRRYDPDPARHTRLAVYFAGRTELGRYASKRCGYRDTIQEAMLAVVIASRKYRKYAGGTTFAGYAWWYVRCRFQRLIVAEQRFRNVRLRRGGDGMPREVLLVSEIGHAAFGRLPELALPDPELGRLADADHAEWILSHLRPRLRRVARAYFGYGGVKPESVKAVAAELGVSYTRARVSVHKAVLRIQTVERKLATAATLRAWRDAVKALGERNEQPDQEPRHRLRPR